MRQRLTNCRLFDGDEVHDGRDLLLDDGRVADIVAAGAAGLPAAERVDLDGHLLAPGLIDLQVNGGGGVLFNDAPDVAALRAIAAAHRQFGATALLPTLITDDDSVMEEAIAAVAQALDEGVPGILGIHLEGPHLNPERKGVHDASRMRDLDQAAVERITSLRTGKTMLTIAPETVPSSAIPALLERGIIVCGGHSAATYQQTRDALDAGLCGFTHLFNAMPPLATREPGMVGAALEDERSFVGIIADGWHVHPALVGIAVAAKAAGKIVLVSDAMPVVGSDRQSFELFGVTVRADSGRCVTPDGTLAGSCIGLIEAVKNVCRFAGVDRFEALRMASTYAANALGLGGELGYIRPGYRASLIELDDALDIHRSWIDGDMLRHGAPGASTLSISP